jgi:hypothetical protein
MGVRTEREKVGFVEERLPKQSPSIMKILRVISHIDIEISTTDNQSDGAAAVCCLTSA